MYLMFYMKMEENCCESKCWKLCMGCCYNIFYGTKNKNNLEKEEFKFNPYNVCVSNIQVNGKQHIVWFHLDDMMSIHVEEKVNYMFDEWLKII